ncbi:MAG: hypothetical protein KF901_07235 [Myxococcales bacterium]|nr:hypothetical protein [Myxococcales bacterium]
MTRSSLLLVLTTLAACGGMQHAGPHPHDPAHLYPMEAGSVWSYDVETGEGPDALAISRVIAVHGDVVEIRNDGGQTLTYERRAHGIYQVGPDRWLLRAPIEVDASWEIGNDRWARITSVSERVESQAGIFEDCVRVEERGGEDRREIDTVYCPGVGPVLLEASMTAELTGMRAAVRATLRAFMLGADAADLVAE